MSEENPHREQATPAAGREAAALGAQAGDLDGRTVVVTRAEDRNTLLQDSLTTLGARTISVPTVRFEMPEDPAPLRDALEALRRRGAAAYGWVLFTSSTGVQFFFETARELGVPESVWGEHRFAVVGPTTASRLASVGIRAERVVIGGKADALGRLLVGDERREIAPGERCLLPQADIGRRDLQERLRRAEVEVDDVVAYRTVCEAPEKAKPFLDAIEAGERVDAITFASPSAFVNFLTMVGTTGETALRQRQIAVFSIGPTTSHAIRERGFSVAAQASPYTANGLVVAVAEYFRPRGRESSAGEADAPAAGESPAET